MKGVLEERMGEKIMAVFTHLSDECSACCLLSAVTGHQLMDIHVQESPHPPIDALVLISAQCGLDLEREREGG